MKQVTQMELQRDFKRENNKPGSKSQSLFESKAIRKAKQIVKTTD